MTYEINLNKDYICWISPIGKKISVIASLTVCADCTRMTTDCPRLRGEQGEIIFKSALLSGTCAWFYGGN